MRRDGQDRYDGKLTVALRNFANALKNYLTDNISGEYIRAHVRIKGSREMLENGPYQHRRRTANKGKGA